MNIFLRIGQSIEDRREYVKALKRYANRSQDYSEAMAGLIMAREQLMVGIGKLFIDTQNGWARIGTIKPNTVPARLRFHYGAAHVEILMGKPITWCKWEEGQFVFTGISRQNPKDTYNWKTGVIVAIENTVRGNLTKESTKALFDALFKKYPELRSK